MAVYTQNLMENYVPNVKYGGGIITNLNLSVGDNGTVTLPAATTIGGSSVVALGNITSTSTTATAFSVTNTGVFTGASVDAITANSATTGTVQLITANGLTSGHGTVITSSGTIVTTGDLLSVIGNSATTSTGLVRVSATGLTTGSALQVKATAATLTTGFYAAFNDGALNVLTVGANGHITSNQTTAPTIAVGTQDGITAAAITAGSTDTAGIITTTGTSTGGTVMTITFNKTYTVAPKVVILSAANAAGGGINSDPIVTSITATTFVITIPTSGVYAATPSWYYLVVA